MLTLSNVRLGFANNSSSSHSILLTNQKFTDINVDFSTKAAPSFGWKDFVCASKKAKRYYLACQLATALKYEIGEEIAGVVVSKLLDVPEVYGEGYVDHASSFNFPRYPDGTLAIEFIKELFASIIDNKKVVILGGNDNYVEVALPEDAVKHPWIIEDFIDKNTPLIVRKEPYGWCLFNRKNGTKIRLLKKGQSKAIPNSPELVDLCITHQCYRNCEFCYQNSTPKGSNANLSHIIHLANYLERLNVFEVVIGGGEPLLHPDFISILENFHNKKIVPNFTTAIDIWDIGVFKEKIEAAIKYAGSIAVSCNSLSEVQLAYQSISRHSRELLDKVVFQSIIGIIEPGDLDEILNHLNFIGIPSYSLVGYKATGRAPSKPPVPIFSYSIKNMLDKYSTRFYVDTALLKLCPELVEEYTCDTTEGTHSIYIDAVNQTVQESSYTGNSNKYIDIEDISLLFQKISQENSSTEV